MTDQQQTTRSAACMCGAVQMTADVEATFGTCYCKMCQRWSAGTFRGVHAHNIRYRHGEDLVTVHRSSDWANRGFCSRCGSNLFYHADGQPVSLAVGILDTIEDMTPAYEFFCDLKPAPFEQMDGARKMTSAEIETIYGVPEDGAAQ